MNGQNYTVPAGILAVALIVSGFLLASGIKAGKDQSVITVTGSAKVSVVADRAKLNSDITRRVLESDLKTGYAQLESDMQKVMTQLTSLGVTEEEITVSSVYASEVWDNNQSGPRRFDLRQSITVQSTDTKKVKTVADTAGKIVAQGVMFQPYAVEYYYSALAEKRVELLGQAIADAKSRATEIAKSAGNRVGVLRSASSGVVQVLAPNSVNVEDYGSYDTSTPDKDIMVTVRAAFEVK